MKPLEMVATLLLITLQIVSGIVCLLFAIAGEHDIAPLWLIVSLLCSITLKLEREAK